MGRATDDGRNILPFRRRPRRSLTPPANFWTACLDRLDAYLAILMQQDSQMTDLAFEYPKNEPSMIVTRSFDAPLALVWRAFTDPVHLMRWWGPQSRSPVIRVEALDLRPGGTWRFVCSVVGRPGAELVFHGTYLDVVPREMISNSFGLEGAFPPDPSAPEQHFFSERDGRTYYRSYTLLPSFEARDGIVATGMESGARESMEQLAELMAEMQVSLT